VQLELPLTSLASLIFTTNSEGVSLGPQHNRNHRSNEKRRKRRRIMSHEGKVKHTYEL